MLLAVGQLHAVGVQPQHGGGERGAAQPGGRVPGLRGREVGEHRVCAVEHEPGQRHLLGGEPVHEVGGLAQRVRLRGGHHQERRAGRAQQRVGGRRAFAEAAEHRVERLHERDASASSWPPRMVETALANSENPAPTILRRPRPPARAGAESRRIMRPSRKLDMRWGASRKSSAERDGGVSTTMRSHSPLAASWPSFSIAMYSCVPEKDVEIVW
ncbi:hypothetical protein BJF78_10275 [Pseudonocardia sp. CNS-139]|nr:hypothetical protein BJF78_10275 [Pseudonocardia sp. CNS-139]